MKQLDLKDGLQSSEFKRNFKELRALVISQLGDQEKGAILSQAMYIKKKVQEKGKTLKDEISISRLDCTIIQLYGKINGTYEGEIDGKYSESLDQTLIDLEKQTETSQEEVKEEKMPFELQQNEKSYKVIKGDNLWKIVAKEYDLKKNSDINNKVKELIEHNNSRENNIGNGDKLAIGQYLILPFAQIVEDEQQQSPQPQEASQPELSSDLDKFSSQSQKPDEPMPAPKYQSSPQPQKSLDGEKLQESVQPKQEEGPKSDNATISGETKDLPPSQEELPSDNATSSDKGKKQESKLWDGRLQVPEDWKLSEKKRPQVQIAPKNIFSQAFEDLRLAEKHRKSDLSPQKADDIQLQEFKKAYPGLVLDPMDLYIERVPSKEELEQFYAEFEQNVFKKDGKKILLDKYTSLNNNSTDMGQKIFDKVMTEIFAGALEVRDGKMEINKLWAKLEFIQQKLGINVFNTVLLGYVTKKGSKI